MGFTRTFSHTDINMLCLHLPSHQSPCLRSLWFIPLHKFFCFYIIYRTYQRYMWHKVQCLFSFHPLFSLVFCSPLSPSTFIGPLQLCPRQYSHVSSLSTFSIYIDCIIWLQISSWFAPQLYEPQLYEMSFQEGEHFQKPKDNSQHICQPW